MVDYRKGDADVDIQESTVGGRVKVRNRDGEDEFALTDSGVAATFRCGTAAARVPRKSAPPPWAARCG